MIPIELNFKINPNSYKEQYLIRFPRENIKIVKERKVKNIFLETRVKIFKKFLNKMKSLLLLFINLIIFTYFFLLANAQSQPSIVTLRYNKTV